MGHPLSGQPSGIRWLRADDRSRWDPLWQDYLAFYDHELPDSTTDLTWSRLVGEDRSVVGLCAPVDDELVGICHLVFHPSTWSPTTTCYLEDLFVHPDRRGSGLGRNLIASAMAEARSNGSTQLYWNTQEGNSVARRLYDRLATNEGFIVYEIDL